MAGLRRVLARVALALTASACGAKTQLEAPDVVPPSDAARDDGVDVLRPPTCTEGQFALTPRAADLILVVDRSGSMAQGLNGLAAPRGSSKWTILRDALTATLPMFEADLGVGALFFPAAGVDPRGAGSCTVPNVALLDVEPALGTTQRVVSVFDTTSPAGATPTAAALLRAYTYFVRHPDRARAHYLVLATDGGPNCNASLNSDTCVCTATRRPGSTLCNGSFDGLSCLDDVRTIDEIAQIASNAITPISTFVIGLAGQADPVFAATLTAMAVAGGRPNLPPGGAPTFYNVAQASDLAAAFTSIQNAISRCSFLTPSRPDDPDAIRLTLDGVSVARDPAHLQGWDWTDPLYGEITLFGAACTAASTHTPRVIATVACRGDGG